MSRIRKLAVVAGTFSFALGIGFVMQNGDVLAARFGPVAAPAGQPAAAMHPGALPREPGPAVLPALPGGLRVGHMPAAFAPPPETPAPVLALSPDGPAAGPRPVAFGTGPETDATAPAPAATEDDCPTAMTAQALPAGLVDLRLSAPCAPLARVTFLHRGMMFTELTDAGGEVALTVPALAANAVFLAEIDGGAGAMAVVAIPEVDRLDRAVLQWQGATGLALHALEYGADYGSAGHVWAGAPHDPATGETGFLIELGDPDLPAPLLAQVYTFPHAQASRAGEVALDVEAEVTDTNCGRELAAQSLQIAPGAAMVAHDLLLPMPGCEAVGDLVLVPGMLADLHLAAY